MQSHSSCRLPLQQQLIDQLDEDIKTLGTLLNMSPDAKVDTIGPEPKPHDTTSAWWNIWGVLPQFYRWKQADGRLRNAKCFRDMFRRFEGNVRTLIANSSTIFAKGDGMCDLLDRLEMLTHNLLLSNQWFFKHRKMYESLRDGNVDQAEAATIFSQIEVTQIPSTVKKLTQFLRTQGRDTSEFDQFLYALKPARFGNQLQPQYQTSPTLAADSGSSTPVHNISLDTSQ